MSDVFTRIRAAVQGDATSEQIRAVIRETRDALSDRAAWRREFEATASNPLVDSAEATRAADAITRSHLDERRLAEGLKLLEPRLAEVAEAERQSELVKLYDAVRAEREAYVAQFRKVWAKHAPALVEALATLRALDGKVVETATPSGRDRLEIASSLLSVDPHQGLLDEAVVPLVALTDAPGWNTRSERDELRQNREAAERRALAQAFVPERPRLLSAV